MGYEGQVHGTLTLRILQIIGDSKKPMFAYDVHKKMDIKSVSYVVNRREMSRLAGKGHLKAEPYVLCECCGSNRVTYSLTEKGKIALQESIAYGFHDYFHKQREARNEYTDNAQEGK